MSSTVIFQVAKDRKGTVLYLMNESARRWRKENLLHATFSPRCFEVRFQEKVLKSQSKGKPSLSLRNKTRKSVNRHKTHSEKSEQPETKTSHTQTSADVSSNQKGTGGGTLKMRSWLDNRIKALENKTRPDLTFFLGLKIRLSLATALQQSLAQEAKLFKRWNLQSTASRGTRYLCPSHGEASLSPHLHRRRVGAFDRELRLLSASPELSAISLPR